MIKQFCGKLRPGNLFFACFILFLFFQTNTPGYLDAGGPKHCFQEKCVGDFTSLACYLVV